MKDVALRSFRFALVAAILLLAVSLVFGQNKQVELTTDSIGISLAVPAGLTPFSDEKMASIREKGIPAKFIFSDSQSDVLLIINIFGNNANETGLSKVAEGILSEAQKQHTFVEVVKRDLISVNGRKWLRLSIKQGGGADAAIDTYFVTDWVGQFVLLDFSAVVAKYDSYKSAFENSARSVQLSLIADTPSFIQDVKKPRRP